MSSTYRAATIHFNVFDADGGFILSTIGHARLWVDPSTHTSAR